VVVAPRAHYRPGKSIVNYVLLILAMGCCIYALRIGGLLLPNVAIPAEWEQALRFLPVALLSALVTVGLAGPSAGGPAGLAAAGIGAVAAWRTHRMWACIATGLATFWLLGLL
jgi:branched-subunit amino acid transport protein